MNKWENEKMNNHFVRYVLMLLLCVMSHTAAFAYGYNQDAQSKSWGYQPVYNSDVSAPTYQFRTTSVYMSSLSDAESGSPKSGHGGVRRTSSPWDWDDDDNPIGEVDDPPTPVGDTPWWFILLLAAGYTAIRSLRQRKA